MLSRSCNVVHFLLWELNIIYLQVWSNDKYESVEHRVMVNSERERFSIPFFFNPSHSATIAPIKEVTSEQNPERYKAYNWGKFHTTRNLSNFKKLNVENIQISHFRIYWEPQYFKIFSSLKIIYLQNCCFCAFRPASEIYKSNARVLHLSLSNKIIRIARTITCR